MDPDALESRCRDRKLKAVCVMPTVYNPLGSVMDMATRYRIVEVARKHDLLLIEDAAYAFLEAGPPLSLFALAPERTVYVGGFSKRPGNRAASGLRRLPRAPNRPIG